MNNVSGNPESWVESKNKETKETKETKTRIPLNLKKELNGILNAYERLEEVYSENPNKDLFDAITTLRSTIISIKNI